jgi:transmembrane sensor
MRREGFSPQQQDAWDRLSTVEAHPTTRAWLKKLDEVAERRNHSSMRSGGRRQWLYSVVAGLAGSVAVAVASYVYLSPAHYETHVGEQRDVVLSDGSRITLNTDTSLDVHYSKSRRFIQLRRGEALFSVTHNATWPFDVSAGGTLTRAIGTAFNVDLRSSKVTVSVLEGTVRVAETAQWAPEELESRADPVSSTQPGFLTVAAALTKGEALELVPVERRAIPGKVDTQRIDAWRARRLEFSDIPLSAAVEEFNRYSRTRVVIGSRQLESVRVSGVFQIGDIDAFVFSLKESLRADALDSAGEVTLVRAPR